MFVSKNIVNTGYLNRVDLPLLLKEFFAKRHDPKIQDFLSGIRMNGQIPSF
jgi:hypothetical protein